MSRIGPMSQIGLMGKKEMHYSLFIVHFSLEQHWIFHYSLFIFHLNGTGFFIIHYSFFI